MLDVLRRLFDAPEEARAAPPEAPAAVAALLVEAARSDADYDPGEAAVIERVLGEMFGLDAAGAAAARAAGEAAQANASDVVRFTRVIKTEMSRDERLRFLAALWSVVLEDGARDPHEDALIRKLTPLIALTDRDSAEARRLAAAARAG